MIEKGLRFGILVSDRRRLSSINDGCDWNGLSEVPCFLSNLCIVFTNLYLVLVSSNTCLTLIQHLRRTWIGNMQL